MFLTSFWLSLETAQRRLTGGVSRVDDAQGSGVAVAPGLIQSTLQLTDVQAPALLLIQVIIDLHGAQFGQRSRVQRVLGYGDHDAGAARTLATHQQLQHGLEGPGEGGVRTSCGGNDALQPYIMRL